MKDCLETSQRRYHGLDLVRAIMMLLGIVIHVAINFIEMPENYLEDPIWPYRDPQRSPIAYLVVMVIHVFRMPIFFLLAGFFAALMYKRRGLILYVKNRFNRILIPFVAGILVLYPLVSFSFGFAISYDLLGDSRTFLGAIQSLSQTQDAMPSGSEGRIWSSDFYKGVNTMHLWFLYYLLMMYLASIFFIRLSNFGFQKIFNKFGGLLGELLIGKFTFFRMPVLILITFVSLCFMENPGIDTDPSFIPKFSIFFAYSIFFLIGWFIYQHRIFIENIQRWAWMRTCLGICFLAACIIFTTLEFAFRFDPEGMVEEGFSLEDQNFLSNFIFYINQFCNSAAIWFLIFGILGLAERYLRKSDSLIRYLVDSSYWIYLAHLPLTVFIPALLRDWEINGTIKMILLMDIVGIVLLITYQLGVRNTFIGKILSGRKYPSFSSEP